MATYRDFYRDKASGYADLDPLGYIRYETAIALADLRPGHRVLDVACKRASMLQVLAELGHNVSYVGVDIAEESIERNRQRFPDTEFVTADVMEGVPLEPGAFDRVFALEIMEHVPKPTILLQTARDLLKHDGKLLLSVPNPYYWTEFLNEIRGKPDTEGHIYSWTDANLHRLFEFTGFEVEARTGTYLEIPTRLRNPFSRGATIKARRVPVLLARSRVYRCHKA